MSNNMESYYMLTNNALEFNDRFILLKLTLYSIRNIII